MQLVDEVGDILQETGDGRVDKLAEREQKNQGTVTSSVMWVRMGCAE